MDIFKAINSTKTNILKFVLDNMNMPVNRFQFIANEDALEIERKKEQKLIDAEHKELLQILKDYDDILMDITRDNYDIKLKNDEMQLEIFKMESEFNNIVRKYEKSKELVKKFQFNEKTLQNAIQINKETISELQSRYDKIKKLGDTKLEEVHKQTNRLKSDFAIEENRLKAKSQVLEVSKDMLIDSVKEKDDENKKLSDLCDVYIR